MSSKDIKKSDWINKDYFPLKQSDFAEGLKDALPTDNRLWCVYDPINDNKEALEWLSDVMHKKTGGVEINVDNFDKEFKKILKALIKEHKTGGELASYYPTVKKAIMYLRRAINHRWGTRVTNHGVSLSWYPGVKKPF